MVVPAIDIGVTAVGRLGDKDETDTVFLGKLFADFVVVHLAEEKFHLFLGQFQDVGVMERLENRLFGLFRRFPERKPAGWGRRR